MSDLRRRVGESLMLRSSVNRAAAWILAVIGPAIAAVGLLPLRTSVGLAGFLSGALVMVVAVAVIGGVWPALTAAIVATVLGAYFYTLPYDSLNIDLQADLVAFLGFIVVGVFFGIVVDQLAGLASQQASLRRVATLVARAATRDELYIAVTEEVARQMPVDFARMIQRTSEDAITFVAASSMPDDGLPVGTTLRLQDDPEGKSVSSMVLRTEGPARIDDFGGLPSRYAATARRLGIRSVVGAPILVEGRVWGIMVVGSNTKRLPADTERRLTGVTDLLAAAIANAESRAELAASRARVVAAADETRRRIERDLHDGTQQRLVSLAIELRAAEGRVPADLPEARAMFSHAIGGLAGTLKNLQEISRGIHPAILTKGGLGPAVKALARRSAVAVELDLRVDRRLPEQIEVAAYYVVAEALTNVDKYAHATLANVAVHVGDSVVELVVRDDGIGGADPSRGSGLVGLKDRVEVLGGTISVSGGAGEGTSIAATIPIDGRTPLVADPAATARPA